MKTEDMKAYTDIEQSKKLAEILPLESADMRYGYIAPYENYDSMYDGGYDEIPYPNDFLIKNSNFSAKEYDAKLPCWSLSSLLNYLREVDLFPKIDADEFNVIMTINYHDKKDGITPIHQIKVKAENFIDAIYEMIIKLHEQKLL